MLLLTDISFLTSLMIHYCVVLKQIVNESVETHGSLYVIRFLLVVLWLLWPLG
jgi:hypothetical protein